MNVKKELSDKVLEKVVGGAGTRENEVTLKILNLIKEKLDLNHVDISGSSSLVNDLGADSLDVVDILQTVETEFGITLSESDALAVHTVADLSQLVLANTKR